MMQSAKGRLAYNLTDFLDWSMVRRIFLQRHMCSADVIVIENIFMQNIMQMPFVKYNHMIKAFSTKCANDTFGDWILPRASRGGGRVF